LNVRDFHAIGIEVKYEELPETPRIWTDFMRSRLPFLQSIPTLQDLIEHRKRVKYQAGHRGDLNHFLVAREGQDSSPVLKNVQRLRSPETVAVVANFYSSLFGGPVYQILKCLTAIRICEELTKHQIEAVPVCWVSSQPPPGFRKWSVSLLDPRSELHELELRGLEKGDSSSPDQISWNRVSELLKQIGGIGQATFDSEILEVLNTVFVRGTTLNSACALLISNLMCEWGMVVLDSDLPEFKTLKSSALSPVLEPPARAKSVMRDEAAKFVKAGYEPNLSEPLARTFVAQSVLLPVLGFVPDPFELHSCAAALPLLDEADLPRPVFWPQPNVTITDSRRRRILAKYNLDLGRLYSGEEEVTKKIKDALPCSAVEVLNGLKLQVNEHITELETLAPGRKKFVKKSASCRERILYQLEKLRKHYIDARRKREQTVHRQIHKACNLLAPNGRLQERELAGIQIPLRYSRAGLRFLYRELDIGYIGHQLVSMD